MKRQKVSKYYENDSRLCFYLVSFNTNPNVDSMMVEDHEHVNQSEHLKV